MKQRSRNALARASASPGAWGGKKCAWMSSHPLDDMIDVSHGLGVKAKTSWKHVYKKVSYINAVFFCRFYILRLR